MFPFPNAFLATLPLRLQRAHARAAEEVSERAKELGRRRLLKFAIAEENERNRLSDIEQAEDRRKVWHFARLEAGYELIGPKSEQARLADEIALRTNRVLNASSNPSWVLEFIGCSYSELWAHLESKFQPGMARENHGDLWQVDHIRPRSSFNLVDPEQYKLCAHFSNLQPLTIEENSVKRAKYSPLT